MAVLDTSKTQKPFIVDRDTNSFVGLKLPLHTGTAEGNFKCTETTIEAVKTNIRNLLQTELGERVFQPALGIRLRQFLFEPFTEEVQSSIRESITKTFGLWLPFVNILELNVDMVEYDDEEGKNTLKVSIRFAVSNSPTAIDSVSVNFQT
tara:strand:+ start:978 stop:1427 length:450 start_codon:yes stop_codon:yes gene_type:complete